MDKRIMAMYDKVKELLKDIPDEDECSEEENEVYSNVQNLKESIDEYINSERMIAAPNLELTSKHLEQIDAVENAVYDVCKIMLDDDELEWDMEMIGECANVLADTLVDLGHRVHYPAIVYSNTGDAEEIIEYIEPDDTENKHIEIII